MSYPELHDALHILIIDDDAVDRRALLRALRAGDSQWTLWEAADRDAAFGLLQHQPMDGILLDYQLPGTDGGAVLHELRARGVHAPVVVVTGQGDEEIAVALMKAGAADYLVKGRITPEVLIRSLRHTIRVAQTEHALRTATSQRDQAEAALAHSEQVLATILRGIGDAVIATDAAKRVIFLNPMAEHLTGWSASEAHGQDFAQVLPLRDVVADHPLAGPPDATAILGTRVVIARALAAPPRGAPFPLAGTCAPIGGAMNDGAVMVFHDMTDHVRTEERLQLLADISHALAASLDPQDSLMRVAELLAGRLADSCAIDLLHPDGTLESVAIQHGAGMAPAAAAEFADRHRRMAKALAQPAREDVETGGAHTAVTVTWLSLPLMAHGDLCGVLSLERATPFRDAERQTATEIAQRSALAVKHALLYQTAHAAVQVRDTFLSIAAHELKTPLTTLSGYIQLLQRRMARIAGIEERDYRALALIADQAHRLNRMIQSLFDVSRLQLGQLTIERAPLDLGALAMRVIQEIEPTLQQHTLKGIVEAPSAVVPGDELRLEQVLQNLIQNAIKYSPGGGTIRVVVAAQETGVEVSVQDSGIGIPDTALGQLFQRFYRAPNTGAHPISGMGVGLYVSHQIVQAHGGSMTVSSVEGEGSTFRFWLPSDLPLRTENQ